MPLRLVRSLTPAMVGREALTYPIRQSEPMVGRAQTAMSFWNGRTLGPKGDTLTSLGTQNSCSGPRHSACSSSEMEHVVDERAVALWPNKGESDPRPALGSTYQRISPVGPHNAIVPENAPAALRLSAS